MVFNSREELQYYVNSGNTVEFLFFWKHIASGQNVEAACLSQWFSTPFEKEGILFDSAEQYMMYQKALLFDDRTTAKRILSCKNPGEAQQLGRDVRDYDQEVWERHRFKIVVDGNVLKFTQNENLKKYLLETASCVLVEASPTDKIWGIGMTANDPNAENPNLWKGQNLLGFALMNTRNQISNR